MRLSIAAILFAAIGFAAIQADVTGQQPAAAKAQQKFDPPKSMKPDEATLKTIAEKTEVLRKAVEGLKAKKIPYDVLIEVEIYLKAAENIVRLEEWYSPTSGRWALQTLERGLERAKQAEGGKASWRDSPGKWVVRAYESSIDDSIQPYAVLLPPDYGKDPKKKWRVDIVLHGRDSALTEAKFIATHGPTAKAAKDQDFIQLEVYGRGNNAYRWAGENDVIHAVGDFLSDEIDHERIVLRGFSMGGAGTWHIGLHYPFHFAAIGPGAGFTTTHGYIGGLPKQLPDYQEKCLRIYDAVDYAENAFNVPIVAYSGSKDPQKAAADNIEKALKGFKEPHSFIHLVAPGLEHQMPKEWQEKAEAEYRRFVAARPFPEKRMVIPDRVRFVTYTTRYGFFGHGYICALDELYKRAVIDSKWVKNELIITTENIAMILLDEICRPLPTAVVIDGQRLPGKTGEPRNMRLEKVAGKWSEITVSAVRKMLRKRGDGDSGYWVQGPIDDAFTTSFKIMVPIREGWHPAIDKYTVAEQDRFVREWDRYFRGKLEARTAENIVRASSVAGSLNNVVLFGDPQSNPLIAEVLPKLPITWTKEKLVVNGVEYDPKTHVPVLIYPIPSDPNRYIVLNSGHTFREADFKGTNALLYPRLGDWAVIKPTPTAQYPAAHEVVAAGLFDENWQFPKK